MGAELEKEWGGEKIGAGAWRISKVAPLGDRGSGIIGVWPVLAVLHLNIRQEEFEVGGAGPSFQAEAGPHDSPFVGFDIAKMNGLAVALAKSEKVKKSLSICCVSLSKSS